MVGSSSTPRFGSSRRVPRGLICQNSSTNGILFGGGLLVGRGKGWEKVFRALQDPDLERLVLDSSVVRAHLHAAGAKRVLRNKLWDVPTVGLPRKSTYPSMRWANPSGSR
jgi:hypothetical protein